MLHNLRYSLQLNKNSNLFFTDTTQEAPFDETKKAFVVIINVAPVVDNVVRSNLLLRPHEKKKILAAVPVRAPACRIANVVLFLLKKYGVKNTVPGTVHVLGRNVQRTENGTRDP